MKKGFPIPVRTKNGSTRRQVIQTLRILVLVFVTMLLSLKFYVQKFPYSLEPDYIACERCSLQESLDNAFIPSRLINDTNDKDINIEPAFQPLPRSNKTYSFTVVTGASENHFCPTKSFLYHMKDTLKGLKARLILYDLGFTHSQRQELKQLQKLGYLTELRTFQWSNYPDFWNITLSIGEYAWKPGMIAEVARDYPGKLIWLDSGTLVERNYFTKLNSLLRKYKGFISPRSSGTMEVWTHPGVYDYYGDDHKKYDNVRNCNGASITFDTTKTQYIIDDWFKCALVKGCIAPPGSSRVNHRQDQSILTYLAAKNNFTCNYKKENLGIVTHQDKDCREHIYEYESTRRI